MNEFWHAMLVLLGPPAFLIAALKAGQWYFNRKPEPAESEPSDGKLEVYVDGERRPDLDGSASPHVVMCQVCCETGRAAYADVNGNRVDIKVLAE